MSLWVRLLLSSCAFTSPSIRPDRPTASAHATNPRMAIAVVGATGGVGAEATYQALTLRNQNVRALVRDPARLNVPPGSGKLDAGKPMQDEKLNVLQGDVKNINDVEALIDDSVTGVVVALGGKSKDVGETMLTQGTSNVISACKKRGIKRIAVVTSIGCGDSENQAPFFFKMLMMTVMRNIFADKNNQENLFFSGPGSDMDYCIVRPGGLSNDPPNGIINVIKGEAGSIARADVAAFCLDALLEDDFAHLRSAPCISSEKGTSWVKEKGMTIGGKVVE